jgi:hypothetical protein
MLQLPACDLIQLDLEGYEVYALYGARETIRRHRPVLIVEINKSAGYEGFGRDEIRRAIAELGYRVVGRFGSDEVFVPTGERA